MVVAKYPVFSDVDALKVVTSGDTRLGVLSITFLAT
jgi:hypothetical protein